MKVALTKVPRPCGHPAMKQAYGPPTDPPVPAPPAPATRVPQVNVTVYVPGLRSTIRYWPVAPATTDRMRSIKAGLDASTVTPGSTAPEESRTVPVIVA